MQKDFTILEMGCVHVGTTGDGWEFERQVKIGKHKMLSNSFLDEDDERTSEKLESRVTFLGHASYIVCGI